MTKPLKACGEKLDDGLDTTIEIKCLQHFGPMVRSRSITSQLSTITTTNPDFAVMGFDEYGCVTEKPGSRHVAVGRPRRQSGIPILLAISVIMVAIIAFVASR